MSVDAISRRTFAGGMAALALANRASAQGYAGLGETADGFAKVTPGKPFSFPADHGPHPEFWIEWWYLTANLVDGSGAACGCNGRCSVRRRNRARKARAGPTSRFGWRMPP